MKTLYLYGDLARRFGPALGQPDRDVVSVDLAVRSVAAAIRLMEANFPGRFANALRDRWIRVGRRNNKACMCEVEIFMETDHQEFHLEPVLQGGIKGLFGLFFGGGLLGGVFTPLGLPLGGAGGAGAAFGIGGAAGGFGSILLGLTIIGVLGLILT